MDVDHTEDAHDDDEEEEEEFYIEEKVPLERDDSKVPLFVLCLFSIVSVLRYTVRFVMQQQLCLFFVCSVFVLRNNNNNSNIDHLRGVSKRERRWMQLEGMCWASL